MNAPAIEVQPMVVRDRRSAAVPEAQPLAPLPADLNQQTVLLQVIARAAADPNVDIGRMTQLLDMHERLNAKAAESDFVAAMAEFKQHAPKITKDKSVGYTNKDGSFTGYKHATLGAVCQAAIAGLGAVGISHRWDLEQQQGGRIVVTCVLTHRSGHSTRTTLSGSPDDSGKKNGIQQVASTITYLERYTLLAATGLATDEQDDDARAAGKPEPEFVNDEQLANLEALISEVGADRKRFLAFLQVGSLEEIYADKYREVVKLLEEKRRHGATGGA